MCVRARVCLEMREVGIGNLTNEDDDEFERGLAPVATERHPADENANSTQPMRGHGVHDAVAIAMCSGCHRIIRDRHYLSAVDRHWHTTCRALSTDLQVRVYSSLD